MSGITGHHRNEHRSVPGLQRQVQSVDLGSGSPVMKQELHHGKENRSTGANFFIPTAQISDP